MAAADNIWRKIQGQPRRVFHYRDLGNLPPIEDFRRDSDLFGESVRQPDAQSRIQAAIKQGFQTREGELVLARRLGDLDSPDSSH